MCVCTSHFNIHPASSKRKVYRSLGSDVMISNTRVWITGLGNVRSVEGGMSSGPSSLFLLLLLALAGAKLSVLEDWRASSEVYYMPSLGLFSLQGTVPAPLPPRFSLKNKEAKTALPAKIVTVFIEAWYDSAVYVFSQQFCYTSTTQTIRTTPTVVSY